MTAATALNFARLREANVARCPEFGHTVDAWSPQRWTIALAGEVGELLNECKKLARGDGSKAAAAAELADVLIYADLLCARLGMVPEEADSGFERVQNLVAGSDRFPELPEPALLLLGSRTGLLCEMMRHTRATREAIVENVMTFIHATAAVANALGIDADQAVVDKFNQVSVRIGSEVRL